MPEVTHLCGVCICRANACKEIKDTNIKILFPGSHSSPQENVLLLFGWMFFLLQRTLVQKEIQLRVIFIDLRSWQPHWRHQNACSVSIGTSLFHEGGIHSGAEDDGFCLSARDESKLSSCNLKNYYHVFPPLSKKGLHKQWELKLMQKCTSFFLLRFERHAERIPIHLFTPQVPCDSWTGLVEPKQERNVVYMGVSGTRLLLPVQLHARKLDSHTRVKNGT